MLLACFCRTDLQLTDTPRSRRYLSDVQAGVTSFDVVIGLNTMAVHTVTQPRIERQPHVAANPCVTYISDEDSTSK